MYKGNKKNVTEQYLFDPDLFVKRPTADQENVNKAIAPYLTAIYEAFEEAFIAYNKITREYPAFYFNSKFPANTINGLVIGKLREKLNGHHFIETAERRTFWMLEGKYWITIKKLKNNYQPSNIPTKNTRKILTQYASKTEASCSILFLGYRINRSDWTKQEGIYITYLDQEKNTHWVTDLRLLSSQSILSDFTLKSEPRPIDIKQDRVQIKKQKITKEA